jgi:hypothetical protein
MVEIISFLRKIYLINHESSRESDYLSQTIQQKATKQNSKPELKWLIIGLICLIFDIIMIIDFYIVGSVAIVTVIIILIAGTMSKTKRTIRFSKIWITIAIMMLFVNPPQSWTPQFTRRWGDNRTDLINPKHSFMTELNSSFQQWFDGKYNKSFNQEMDFEIQVRAVDIFIREVIFIYTLDQYNYPWSIDHLPTIDEILATTDDEGKLHDDCDGISIITTSFLINLGFLNTYISEVTYHYHTMVFQEGIDPKTKEGYKQGISLYKGRVLVDNDKQSYYLFNQTEIFVPEGRPIYKSVFEIYTDGNVWKFDITELYSGEITGLPVFLNYAGIYVLFLGVSAFLISWVQMGLIKKVGKKDKAMKKHEESKSKEKKREKLKLLFLIGTILYFALTLNNIIAMGALSGYQNWTFLCNPILSIAFVISISLINRKLEKKSVISVN